MDDQRIKNAFAALAIQSAMLHYGQLLEKGTERETARGQAIFWVASVIASLEGTTAEELAMELKAEAAGLVDKAISDLYPSHVGPQN